MNADIRVFDHPYYALTDEDGKFEIPLAPAGDYRLKVEHLHLWGGPDDNYHLTITLADPGFDPPPELHGLAEHGRLANDAFRPQHALVALPPLAITGQAGGHEPEPAMEPLPLGWLDELVEVGRVVQPAEERVVESAGDEHAAAPAAEPAHAHRLHVPGTHHTGRREPCKRAAVELAPPHVHRAVDQHVELVLPAFGDGANSQ